MAPGSLHSSGALYEWQNPEAEVADLPQAWLDHLTGKHEQRAAAEVVPLPARAGGSSAYGQKALETELQALSQVGEGSRNHSLNAAAFSLGQLVGGGELDRSTVEAELKRVALAIGLEEREVQSVLSRAVPEGMAQPRQAPERPQATVRKLDTVPPPQAAEKAKERPETDLGNAERLRDNYGDRLRYCGALGGWLGWDGSRWQRDETGEARRLAHSSARLIRQEAEGLPEAQAEKRKRHASRSESSTSITRALEEAKVLKGLATASDDWDKHPLLLCVENGLLDLESGKLLPHDRSKLITRLAAVTYDPKAEAPLWEKFLEEILPDPDLRAFAQRLAGLCLTGDRSAQAFFVLVGPGANGKSVFVETLRHLAGDYAVATPSSMLLSKRDNAVPNDVARLRGARLVVAQESAENRKLDEALIKQLTGGDRITARYMRAEFFEFDFEGKLLLSTNHKPRVTGRDDGIWRRIKVVPFEVSIPQERQDKRLGEKLRAELPGILLWAAEGYRDYLKRGRQLDLPAVVEKANAEYRAAEDSLADFLEQLTHGPEERVAPEPLYEAYKSWAEAAGERKLSQSDLKTQLESRGYEQKRGAKGVRYWPGLSVSPSLLADTSSSS